MAFNSFEFLIFSTIFFPAYFFSRGQTRILVCVLASYVFYSWWDFRFASLLAGSTVVGYFCGYKIHNSESFQLKKLWLWTSIIIHLIVLFIFKYFDFFLENFSSLLKITGLESRQYIVNIVLPVGISFYTFQTLSYTIDIYKDKILPEKKILNFFAYVALFPQLVAGPIVRASVFLPQLKTNHTWSNERIGKAMELIAWGLFLKICLADNAALFVDVRFDQPLNYSPSSLALSTFFFAFQIYGDFAGYSLIAIGIGKILGFEFGINFNKPYFSSSFSEFWKRWHISLSSWIRDYIYIPLGGGQDKPLRNVVITMFLSGLWHGANWTFIFWGLLHAFYLATQRPLIKYIPSFPMKKTMNILLVFLLTCIAWIFFRANNLTEAFIILERILLWKDSIDLAFGGQAFIALKVSMLIALTLAIDAVSCKSEIKDWYQSNKYVRVIGISFIISLIPIFGAFGTNQFIYFQF